MKTIKKLLLTATAIFAVATVSAQTLNDVKAKYNEAAGLIQAKKFDQAITALDSTIEMGLEVPEASDVVAQAQKLLPACYFQVAVAQCKVGKFSEALGTINTTVNFGQMYGDANSVRKAKALASKAYISMGAESFNKKDYKKAAEVFKKGYEANKTDTEIAAYLAESYSEDGNYTEGFKVYDEIIALEAKNARFKPAADAARGKKTYYLTVQASDVAKKGNTTEAYRLLDEILKSEPDNAFAHMTKIQTATNAEQWSRVIQWADKAAAAQTESAQKSEAYFLLAAAYQNTEEPPYTKAIATYKKVTAGNKVEMAKEQIEALTNPPKK